MAMDVDKLLAPLSGDEPCGEDVAYDPAFIELEKTAKGTPGTQVGDFVQEGSEPDWKDVRRDAMELLGRSKDLRLILYLTLSSLCLDGVTGLRDGLKLLRGVLERYWAVVHPRLDPDDGNDPLERMNIIASLSPPVSEMSDREPMQFKARLLRSALCKPSDARVPAPSLRAVLVASGEAPPPAGGEEALPDAALVEAAFRGAPVEQLQETERTLAECLEHLAGVDAFLAGVVAAASRPNLDGLARVLGQAHRQVAKRLGDRGYAAEGASAAAGSALQPASSSAPGPSVQGGIHSKEDVSRALDQIAEYFERHEPSSPVPLLVRRARRLVGMSFVDIIRDLSPDAISQVNVVSGEKPQEG